MRSNRTVSEARPPGGRVPAPSPHGSPSVGVAVGVGVEVGSLPAGTIIDEVTRSGLTTPEGSVTSMK